MAKSANDEKKHFFLKFDLKNVCLLVAQAQKMKIKRFFYNKFLANLVTIRVRLRDF